MMGILSRIAGPRVLLGVLLAAGLAIGYLLWSVNAAREDAATAETQNRQLRTTVNEQSKDHKRLRAELDRRNDAVNEALEGRERVSREAEQARNQLEKALADDTCANTEHPAAVTDSLQQPASGTAKD